MSIAGMRLSGEALRQGLFYFVLFVFGVGVSFGIVSFPLGYVLLVLGFIVFWLIWKNQKVWLFLVILLTTFRVFDNTLAGGFLSWSQVLTGLVLLIYIFRLLIRKASFLPFPPLAGSFLLVLLWACLSGLWSIDYENWFYEIFPWVRLFILFWLINNLFIEDEGVLRWAVFSLIISTTLNSVFGAYVVIFRPGWLEALAFKFYSGVPKGELPGIGEIWTFYGFNRNNSGLALMLCYGIFFLIFLLQRHGLKRSLRWGLFIGFLFQIFLLINTFSRTGWVAFCVGLLFFLPRVRFKHVLLILCVVGVLGYFYGPLILAKWSILPGQAGGYSGRFPELRAALEAFSRSPILGLGLGGYSEAVEFRSYLAGGVVAPSSIHNTYLKFLVELGVVGFLLMSWVVIDLLRVYRVNSRIAYGGALGLNRSFGACLVSSAVYALSQGLLYFNLFWILLGLFSVFSLRLRRADGESSIF